MEKVLIAGANGHTGTRLVQILKNHGQYKPVALIRKHDQKEKFDNLGVDVKEGDLEEDLTGKLDDIDQVIFAAGSGSSTGKEKTIEVDEKGAIKLIDEAKKVNLKKFVMLSAMGADDPSSNEKLETYLKAKHNADEHLKSSGLNYCIVRPGMLTDDDDTGKIKADQQLNEKGKITRGDVAHVLVSALDHTNLHNKTIEILEGNDTYEEALSKV